MGILRILRCLGCMVAVAGFLACGADGNGDDAGQADGTTDILVDPDSPDTCEHDSGVKDPGSGDPCVADPDVGHMETLDPGFVDPGGQDPGATDFNPGIDALAVQCGTVEHQFPDFDKNCASDADCALVFHTINCCGTEIALGINKDQVPAFDAAEALCDSQYPGCGCAQDATLAEDGNKAWGQDAFGVSCDAFKCRSHVLPTCDDLAWDYFQAAGKLDWCTGPDQCLLAPSGLCVNSMGCQGLIVNEDADWAEADAILAQSKTKACPDFDETCECPPLAALSFGCSANQCVPCEKACPANCPCQRDYQGCPTGECGLEACEALEAQIEAAVAQVDGCDKNADCMIMELAPICGSLSCRQEALAKDTPQDQLNDLHDLGFQAADLGCDGFHCGCGYLGASVCIDGGCRMCPPDCAGSCQGLIEASQELAQDSRTCWGAGTCVVPDVCSTCGTAVNKQAANKELFFMGLALKEACGPCDLWCRLMPLPYQAACVSGLCEMLSYGNECAAIEAEFDALVGAPDSLACESVEDCQATSITTTPFCTGECACAVITNKSAAQWVKTLNDEYQLLGCPSEPCPCTKCMTVVQCVDGFCT